jgi:hypothetical protein
LEFSFDFRECAKFKKSGKVKIVCPNEDVAYLFEVDGCILIKNLAYFVHFALILTILLVFGFENLKIGPLSIKAVFCPF